MYTYINLDQLYACTCVYIGVFGMNISMYTCICPRTSTYVYIDIFILNTSMYTDMYCTCTRTYVHIPVHDMLNDVIALPAMNAFERAVHVHTRRFYPISS